jgi:hypothetical protein
MALATKPPVRPKAKVTHKKRIGKHHRHGKDYLKSYWPYIPMLAIVGIGLLANSILTHPQHVLGDSSDFSSTSLLLSTNAQRVNAHETALTLSSALTAAAQSKANDMSKRNYWSHDTPDGRAPWSFVVASGYSYEKAGENLAYGFSGAEQTIVGWMNSPEHRANILSAGYEDVGFGVSSNPDYQGKGPETIIVALYGTPAGTASRPLQATNTTTQSAFTSSGTAELAATPVSRIQLLTAGHAPWSLVLVSTLLGAMIAIFVTKHGLYWHRLLQRGEHFVIRHPFIEIGLVSLATLAFVLSQASGVIR